MITYEIKDGNVYFRSTKRSIVVGGVYPTEKGAILLDIKGQDAWFSIRNELNDKIVEIMGEIK